MYFVMLCIQLLPMDFAEFVVWQVIDHCNAHIHLDWSDGQLCEAINFAGKINKVIKTGYLLDEQL